MAGNTTYRSKCNLQVFFSCLTMMKSAHFFILTHFCPLIICLGLVGLIGWRQGIRPPVHLTSHTHYLLSTSHLGAIEGLQSAETCMFGTVGGNQGGETLIGWRYPLHPPSLCHHQTWYSSSIPVICEANTGYLYSGCYLKYRWTVFTGLLLIRLLQSECEPPRLWFSQVSLQCVVS